MKHYKQLIIGLGVAALALWYTLRNVPLDELMASFKTVQYVYILPALVLIVAIYVVRAYRWRILLNPLKDIPVKEIYSPLMVGFLANVLPARGGEVVRAYLMSKKQSVAFTGVFATIVVERLFDLVMVLALFAYVLVVYSGAFQNAGEVSGLSFETLANQFGIMAAILIVALMVFIYMLVTHKEKLLKIVRWFLRPLSEKWREKILHLIDTFSDGLLVARDPAALAKIFFLTALTWVLIIASYYPFYWAYDVGDRSMESLLILVLIVCIMITVLPTPAFLGSFQAGIVVALHEIMQENELMAASFGMIAWAVNFGVVLVLGVYYILHDHISVTKLIEEEEKAEEMLD